MTRARQITFVTGCRYLLLLIGGVLLLVHGADALFRLEPFRDGLGWLVRWIPVSELDPWPLFALGLLMLLLPLFYLVLAMVERRLERGITGKGTDGEDICLRPEAVERTLRREIRHAVPELIRIVSCRVRQGSRGPEVTIRVSVSDRSPVPPVRRKVQETVTATLERLIGFSKGSRVVVQVVELSNPHAKGRRRAAHPSGRHSGAEGGAKGTPRNT